MAKKKAARKTPTRRKKAAASGVTGTKIPAKYQKAVARARKAEIGSQVWKPENEGDAIAGRILSASWREGKFNKVYCSLLIDADPSPVLVRPGSILSRQLQDLDVRVGAEVVIVYRGTVPTGYGRPANAMALEVVQKGTGDPVYVPPKEAQAPKPRRSKKKKKVARKRTKE